MGNSQEKPENVPDLQHIKEKIDLDKKNVEEVINQYQEKSENLKKIQEDIKNLCKDIQGNVGEVEEKIEENMEAAYVAGAVDMLRYAQNHNRRRNDVLAIEDKTPSEETINADVEAGKGAASTEESKEYLGEAKAQSQDEQPSVNDGNITKDDKTPDKKTKNEDAEAEESATSTEVTTKNLGEAESQGQDKQPSVKNDNITKDDKTPKEETKDAAVKVEKTAASTEESRKNLGEAKVQGQDEQPSVNDGNITKDDKTPDEKTKNKDVEAEESATSTEATSKNLGEAESQGQDKQPSVKDDNITKDDKAPEEETKDAAVKIEKNAASTEKSKQNVGVAKAQDQEKQSSANDGNITKDGQRSPVTSDQPDKNNEDDDDKKDTALLNQTQKKLKISEVEDKKKTGRTAKNDKSNKVETEKKYLTTQKNLNEEIQGTEIPPMRNCDSVTDGSSLVDTSSKPKKKNKREKKKKKNNNQKEQSAALAEEGLSQASITVTNQQCQKDASMTSPDVEDDKL